MHFQKTFRGTTALTELTEEQLAYLQKHKVPLGSVFDATGLGRRNYSAKMKALGKAVAYGVTPCKKAGHTLRSRSGGCIQFSPAVATLLRKQELANGCL